MVERQPFSAAAEAAVAKVRRRLVPFLFLLYIVSYLDRINVGFAALQMNEALGLSATAFGFGSGIFFLSYMLFEIPSNIMMVRMGARLWIARIMITWGIVSAGMMFLQTPGQFYVLRFVLGAAEAGFFPGVIYYLSQWVPQRERARTVAAFMTAILAAGVVGGPISGALLNMQGVGNLAGWQWMFLLEGAPAVVLGFVVWWWLPNGPAEATWLREDERAALLAALEADAKQDSGGSHSAADALRDWRIWLLALVYFTIPLLLYTFGFWLPQILQANGVRSKTTIGWLSTIPYLVGASGMLFVARHSDRTGERRWHLIVAAVVGGIAFASSAFAHSVPMSLVALSLAMLGLSSMFGPFWALATSSVRGVGAAVGIALINSIGNTGGFFGPYIVGYFKDTMHDFTWGSVTVGSILAIVPFLALVLPGRGATSQPARRV